MSFNEDITYSAVTGDFQISAVPEILDSADCNRVLLAYCLRIENNSDKPICLLKRNFCITDNHGRNYYDCGQGFHNELPDLQPGEYYEFEDTAVIEGQAAVLYGYCTAVDSDGKETRIKLPFISLNLSAEKSGKISDN